MSEKNTALSEKTMLLIAMNKVLAKHYRELKNKTVPKPEKIGGTYYGRTEIFSSVGNHLNYFHKARHTSYGYAGLNTNYKDACYLRIGGAYKYSTSGIEKELKEVLGGNYNREYCLGIIDDYGTNFSTIGFGVIVH